MTLSDGAGSWCAGAFGQKPSPTGPISFVDRPQPTITIAMAPVKGDRTATAVEKLTELGVDRIVVLDAARSVVRWNAERARTSLDRLRAVAKAAAEQSRQLWIPLIEGPVALDALVELGGVSIAERGGSVPDLSRTDHCYWTRGWVELRRARAFSINGFTGCVGAQSGDGRYRRRNDSDCSARWTCAWSRRVTRVGESHQRVLAGL